MKTTDIIYVDKTNNFKNKNFIKNLVKTRFKKDKYQTFKNFGLVAVQSRSIGDCAILKSDKYSMMYSTVLLYSIVYK